MKMVTYKPRFLIIMIMDSHRIADVMQCWAVTSFRRRYRHLDVFRHTAIVRVHIVGVGNSCCFYAATDRVYHFYLGLYNFDQPGEYQGTLPATSFYSGIMMEPVQSDGHTHNQSF